MIKLSKKHSVKIPDDIFIIYSEKKRIVYLKGSLGQKSLKLKVKILLNRTDNILQVTRLSFVKVSGDEKDTLKYLQGTTTALIKQAILEVSILLHKKLKLVGVGYRAFPVELFEHPLLQFKLGYSHQIYIKISNDLKFFCFKTTKLFVFGNSYQNISQILATIRSYKKPEPYKGKGILYANEKISLKEGKKV